MVKCNKSKGLNKLFEEVQQIWRKSSFLGSTDFAKMIPVARLRVGFGNATCRASRTSFNTSCAKFRAMLTDVTCCTLCSSRRMFFRIDSRKQKRNCKRCFRNKLCFLAAFFEWNLTYYKPCIEFEESESRGYDYHQILFPRNDTSVKRQRLNPPSRIFSNALAASWNSSRSRFSCSHSVRSSGNVMSSHIEISKPTKKPDNMSILAKTVLHTKLS